MAQKGVLKCETSSGIIDIPLFEEADITPNESWLRVETPNGISAIKLTDPADAEFNEVRIKTANDGIKSPDILAANIIDDYEDGDLVEYQKDPGTSDGIFDSNLSKVGSAALKIETFGDSWKQGLESTGGLDNYAKIGDYVSWWFKIQHPIESNTAQNDPNITVVFKRWTVVPWKFNSIDIRIELEQGNFNPGDQANILSVAFVVSGNDETITNVFNFGEWYQIKAGFFTSNERISAILLDEQGNLISQQTGFQTTIDSSDWLRIDWATSRHWNFEAFLDHVILIDPLVTVDFSRSPSAPEVYVSETVQFTDLSTSDRSTIDAWEWNFGDGTTSTVQNPTHSYGSTGTYTVKFTAEDGLDFRDTITREITVVEILDDFEDQSLSEYQGTTANWTITEQAANQRQYGVETAFNQNSGLIFDTGQTVSQGDILKADILIDASTAIASFVYGVQDDQNYYMLTIDHENELFRLVKREINFGDVIVDETAFIPDLKLWYTVRIAWGSGGSHSIELIDEFQQTLKTLSGTEDTFTSGGFGFRCLNDRAFFDFARKE